MDQVDLYSNFSLSSGDYRGKQSLTPSLLYTVKTDKLRHMVMNGDIYLIPSCIYSQLPWRWLQIKVIYSSVLRPWRHSMVDKMFLISLHDLYTYDLYRQDLAVLTVVMDVNVFQYSASIVWGRILNHTINNPFSVLSLLFQYSFSKLH